MAAATQTASIFHAIVSRLWALFDHAALPLQLVAYLFFWPILEALFFFRVRRYTRLRSAQKMAHHNADTTEVERFWMRVLEEEDGAAVDDILRGWFLGDGPICEGNLEELVAWTLFASPAHMLTGTRRTRVLRVLARLIHKVGTHASYPPGFNPSRRCMLHAFAQVWVGSGGVGVSRADGQSTEG